MRHFMMFSAIALAGAAIASGPSAAPSLPAWLTGCWVAQTAQKWTEECWTRPRAGTMLGSGRNGVGDRLQSWEAMQILAGEDGNPVFWASPRGGTRIAFGLVSQGAAEIVFANPAHDYPQRVRYWREGRTLNAETSLADGGKPMRWRYQPAD